MKEALVDPDGKVKIIDSPIPNPESHEVLIKVVFSGSNPKDWKRPMWQKTTHNSGDDIAGTVEKVGKAVSHMFFPGQRVAAFHVIGAEAGSFAEYAIAPAHTTFPIPETISLEQAAAVPLAAMTAAVGLFIRLGLPEPWGDGGADGKRSWSGGPLIIYGAASSVGAYAIQLAKRAGIGPLYCVAGRGIPFVETLLDTSNGDRIIDYRKGDQSVVEELKSISGAQTASYAFDAVSEKGSCINIGKVLSEKGKITMVLPTSEADSIPTYIERSATWVSCVHKDQRDFGHAWFQLIAKGLEEGWFKCHPTEVIPGGLEGIETGLKNLREGKASAVKYVFRIADTPGSS